MKQTEVVLAVDIGGTNTAVGLLDREGVCHYWREYPTDSTQPAERLFAALFTELAESPAQLTVQAIGIGAPNANYLHGTIEHPPNLHWDIVDLPGVVAGFSSLPVAVDNDANAAALGELLFGAAQGKRNFVEITLGTGLGSGIVCDGELWRGQHGYAGEIGHVIVEPGGRPCGCGRRGCLETYASAPGLVVSARELMQVHSGSRLPEMEEAAIRAGAPDAKALTARDVHTAAQAGDPAALAAFELTGQRLGLALANSAAYLDPEAFVLFGGVALAGDFLLEPVRKHLNANLLMVYRGGVEVLLSALPGAKAAVMGAAALAWKKLD